MNKYFPVCDFVWLCYDDVKSLHQLQWLKDRFEEIKYVQSPDQDVLKELWVKIRGKKREKSDLIIIDNVDDFEALKNKDSPLYAFTNLNRTFGISVIVRLRNPITPEDAKQLFIFK